VVTFTHRVTYVEQNISNYNRRGVSTRLDFVAEYAPRW